MKTSTVIVKKRTLIIKLIHHETDQSMWIVRCWKTFFGFKRRIASHWFNDKRQALAFANEFQQNYQSDTHKP